MLGVGSGEWGQPGDGSNLTKRDVPSPNGTNGCHRKGCWEQSTDPLLLPCELRVGNIHMWLCSDGPGDHLDIREGAPEISYPRTMLIPAVFFISPGPK